ncbi:Variant surface glycoprotein [Sesbania bispinosa]|nr:Variant surface glycoprotein [Sesbania bispinosa]
MECRGEGGRVNSSLRRACNGSVWVTVVRSRSGLFAQWWLHGAQRMTHDLRFNLGFTQVVNSLHLIDPQQDLRARP